MSNSKRKKNLIRPALQLKITVAFMITSVCLVALLAFLIGWRVTVAANDLPSDSAIMMQALKPAIFESLGITLVILLPMTLSIGILVTFLIAGPIHRFEQFLHSTIRGEKPADCSIRKHDELKDFCQLLNEATAPLRVATEEEDTEDMAHAA